MRLLYLLFGVGATVFAGVLLALQIVGGLEYTKSGTLYTQASMVVAMVTVALLPIFIHAAWKMSRAISLVLFIGFVAFLAYSLPANIGRLGETKEVKALAAADAVTIQAQIADLDKTLRFAEPDMASECKGAPEPVTPPAWPECRRKRGSVEAFRSQRAALAKQLADIGNDRLGDMGSDTTAWLLTVTGIDATTVRKGSVVAFALGLEVAIFGLVWLAAMSFGRCWHPVAKPVEVRVTPAAEHKSVPPPKGGTMTKLEAERDLVMLLALGKPISSQDELAERWGVGKGTASKWLSDWEERGLVTRAQYGRCKQIVAA